MSDSSVETLFLPFTSGALAWPENDRVLFMRGRANAMCRYFSCAQVVCEQTFKPYADALVQAGAEVSTALPGEKFSTVLILLPRQREESRALLARAFMHAAEGGSVLASLSNHEGARSGEADMKRLIGPVQSISKNKSRVFWTIANSEAIDWELAEQWALLDTPRLIVGSRFLSRPGLFAWDRIDTGSKLLAEHLPYDLAGDGADLGAGFGYLAANVLARCPSVTALDLYEAEARALDLARVNLSQEAERTALNFFWHDVTIGLSRRYDFIVSNPPFHQGRIEQPNLGCAFITTAAASLVAGGRFWLVANRHLPYEQTLAENFASVRSVTQENGFKVIEAVKAAR